MSYISMTLNYYLKRVLYFLEFEHYWNYIKELKKRLYSNSLPFNDYSIIVARFNKIRANGIATALHGSENVKEIPSCIEVSTFGYVEKCLCKRVRFIMQFHLKSDNFKSFKNLNLLWEKEYLKMVIFCNKIKKFHRMRWI